MLIRNFVILGLVAIGFVIAARDPASIAVGCWVVAVVYALLTSHRRIL